METKLEQIIAEASAFTEYSRYTDDAFILIRDLAKEVLSELVDESETTKRPGKT